METGLGLQGNSPYFRLFIKDSDSQEMRIVTRKSGEGFWGTCGMTQTEGKYAQDQTNLVQSLPNTFIE